MKKLLSLLVLVCLVSLCLTGCPSFSGGGDSPVSVPSLIPKTMNAVCGLWRTVKPHYPKVRAEIIEHREKIEERVPGAWDALVTVDQYAVELDAGLSIICSGSSGAARDLVSEKRGVPWDLIGSAVVKLGTVYLQSQAMK